MKKLLLLVVLVLAVGVGAVYAGVMPAAFFDWVDEIAPPAVAQALFNMGGMETQPPRDEEPGGRATATTDSAFSILGAVQEDYIIRQVIQGVWEHREGIEIPVSLPGDSDEEITDYLLGQVEQAVDIIRRDHPEVFWISLGSYVIEWSGSREDGQGVLKVHIGYCHSASQRESIQKEMEMVMGEVLAHAPSDAAEAVTYFHDWIVEHTVYATDLAGSDLNMQGYEYGFNADGVFLRGRAVCEGYSKAFKLLCDRAGIPCVSVFGEARGENHSWNYVELDGAWYLVDATWDDPVGAENVLLHTYHLKGGGSDIDGTPLEEIYRGDGADYPPLAQRGYYE